MANPNVVVIGGSAGSGQAIAALLNSLPPQLPAAFFVVVHMDPAAESWFADRLAQVTRLEVISPLSRRPVRDGRVYVARPDHHLIVDQGSVLATRGPRENLWRPAIDVLFRSAAVDYTSRVIGILMSGQLDDGTAGLQAIKACGGTTIVQDPEDSLFDEMPRNAVANAPVDHCVPASRLPELVVRLVNDAAIPSPPVPQDLRDQVLIALGTESMPVGERSGTLSPLSCPECGGPLWRGGEDELQFRCLTGHSYPHTNTDAGRRPGARSGFVGGNPPV